MVRAFTKHTDEEYVQRGFEVGAKGYVTKDATSEERKEAVQVVARGGKFVSPGVAGRNVEESAAGGRAKSSKKEDARSK